VTGESVEEEELRRAIRAATIDYSIVPVLCGSALRNKGIQRLLDAVVDYLPSPVDVPPVKGVNPVTGEEEERKPDDGEPFTGLAFKIMTDPYVGRLTYVRVYSGVLRSGDTVQNACKGKRERIGRLLFMHANKREETPFVASGDICAIVGLKFTQTGDTLCETGHPIILESMKFPEPVISVAIEPKTKAEQDKLTLALQKLADEDPTFKVKYDEETGQTLISGMGEFHLEVLITRLLREFGVQAHIGKPQVAYKETVRTTAEAEGKFIRQTGGRGQYGHVWLRVEPSEEEFEFVDAITGGVVPKEFIPAVEEGVREALETGVLGGYPVVNVRVTAFDGSYHEVDSSDIAFKIAASLAFKEAARKAHPALLEPIMKVDVFVPEEYIGEVVSDLNGRRGKIESIEVRGTTRDVRAYVPLAEMFGYATDLRSLTQGRATFVMEFSHYEVVPDNIAEHIIAGYAGMGKRWS